MVVYGDAWLSRCPCLYAGSRATRGLDTVWVTKVEERASEADFEQGRVREEDILGNAEADTAAVLGTRHQSEVAVDARRAMLNAWTISTPSFFSCIGSWLLSLGVCQS